MTEAAVEPCLIEGGADWLSVEINSGRMARPDLPAPDWRIGLSAVI